MKPNEATAVVEGDELVIRIRLPASPAPAPADELIRLEQTACAEAGFPLSGLQALVRTGDLPIVKVGRASYVRLSDLLALAKPVRPPPPSPVAPVSGAYEVALAMANTKRRRRAGAG